MKKIMFNVKELPDVREALSRGIERRRYLLSWSEEDNGMELEEEIGDMSIPLKRLQNLRVYVDTNVPELVETLTAIEIHIEMEMLEEQFWLLHNELEYLALSLLEPYDRPHTQIEKRAKVRHHNIIKGMIDIIK